MTYESDFPFRMTCILFGVVGWGVRFAFQLGMKPMPVVHSIRRRRERWSYWLVGAAFLLAFLYAVTPWLDFAHVEIPTWVRWPLGALGNLAALGLFLWTHRTLGRNWSGILELRAYHHLVTNGPYRWVRHPMYTAFFLYCFALFALSANWFVGLISFAAMCYFYLRRINDEENMMLERFDDAYRQYMSRTGRLVPRMRLADRCDS
jgi:protein-S-isoprenylcysteine O-methyltransferase Ste14